MKILLLGGAGQLGKEISDIANTLRLDIVSPIRRELDVTDFNGLSAFIKKISPDVIINSAAYTAVDMAEEDEEKCYEINSQGVKNLSLAVREIDSFLIHVSTDYVYGDNFTSPIIETANTEPLNVYGKSKLEGDRAVLEILPNNSSIVRTSSLHGQYGANFVHTMIKLFEEREEVSVVRDQIVSPTWTQWLARVLVDLAKLSYSKKNEDRSDICGILHASSKGEVSWYDFASAIYSHAASENLEWKAALRSTLAINYKTKARRPAYSVLDCSRLENILGREVISWQDGLKGHLGDIGRYSK